MIKGYEKRKLKILSDILVYTMSSEMLWVDKTPPTSLIETYYSRSTKLNGVVAYTYNTADYSYSLWFQGNDGSEYSYSETEFSNELNSIAAYMVFTNSSPTDNFPIMKNGQKKFSAEIEILGKGRSTLIPNFNFKKEILINLNK